jgi:hypothetical protein
VVGWEEDSVIFGGEGAGGGLGSEIRDGRRYPSIRIYILMSSYTIFSFFT